MGEYAIRASKKLWLAVLIVFATVLCACGTAYAADQNVKTSPTVLTTTYYSPTSGNMLPKPAKLIEPADPNKTVFIGGEGDWWYVVRGNVSMEGRLEIFGKDVNIIVENGATLTVHGGIFIREKTPQGDNCKLTIWGSRKGGTGVINAGATWSDEDSMTAELRAGQKADRAGAGIGAIPGQAGGDLVINGGTIYAVGYEKSAGIGGSYRQAMRSVVINDGTVNARPGSLVGKDFEGGCGIGSGIYSPGFPITINGGTVKARGGAAAAGIGGSMASSEASHDDNTYAGPITITGGTVTAIGGSKGAGIGSGWLLPTKKIEITGGTVTAAGFGGGAGIGGGNNEDGQGGRNWPAADLIKISGGTVKAYAYNEKPTLDLSADDFGLKPEASGGRTPKTEDAAGAGIGAGQHAHSGKMEIDGGDIFAWSAGWAAGIGGGSRGDFNDTLTIRGGKVVAIGGCSAAGIGGGFAGNQNWPVYIEGGEVYAYAGVDWQRDYNDSTHGGAGIGGGKEDWYNTGGVAGHVEVTGGKVVACGGSSFPVAIGIGYNETKEVGDLVIADDMRVRWCAGCDLTKYRKDANGNWLSDQWLGTPREPADPSKLHTSNAATRASDCKHMTYVEIDKCPHPHESQGSLTDYSATQHYETFSCNYCNSSEAVTYSNHEFDSSTHECACGHKQYQVAFYGDETVDPATGSALESDYYSSGAQVTQVPDVGDTRADGATFAGWFEKKADGTLEDTAFDLNTVVSGNVRLFAKWIPASTDPTVETCTVKFFDENGTLIQASEVAKGGKVTAPEAPKRQGYKFDGWYTKVSDGSYYSEPFDLDGEIHFDFDLYQKWSVNEHTVTFHPENGTANTTQTVADGALAQPPADPTPATGKKFAGWCEKTSEGQLSPIPFRFSATPITKDVDLYADWKTAVCVVTFDARDGVFAPGAYDMDPHWVRVQVNYGEKVATDTPALEKPPARDGYVFDGWYRGYGTTDSAGADASEEPYNFNDEVTSDITLVAHWTKAGNEPVVTAPVGKALTYNGEVQGLADAGTVDGGVMRYALGTKERALTDFGPTVPDSTDAGTYYVWYFAEGDALYKNSAPAYVVANIAKMPISPKVSIDGWTEGDVANAPVLDEGSNPGAGDVAYEYAAEGSDAWSATPPTKAGAYTVRASVPETTNYLDGQATAKFTIAAAPDVAPKPETKPEAEPEPIPAVPDAEVSGTLLAKMAPKGKKKLVISWAKVDGADGYDIFFSSCNKPGKSITPKKVKTIKGNSKFKWSKAKLKGSKAYKAFVRAFVMKDGEKTYVSQSLQVHAFTGGGTSQYTNTKKVTVKKSKLTVKVGKSAKVKAKVTKLKKSKKLMSEAHAPKLRYLSTDTDIATVSKAGKVKGRQAGTCYVYAIAHNGVSKRVKVTVK